MNSLNSQDRVFIDVIRGASILRVMLMHLGLGWFYLPYSTMFTLFFPVLFFVSGAVTFNSMCKSHSAGLFLLRRTSLILTPYVIFMMLLLLIFFVRDVLQSDATNVNWYSIIVVRPMTIDSGVHLGHIWFLQSLMVITLVSTPVFALFKQRTLGVLLLFLASIGLILFNALSRYNLMVDMDVYGISFYIGLANLYFFCLGILYFTYQNWFSGKRLWWIFSLLVIAFMVQMYYERDFKFNHHRNNLSLIYVVGSSITIFALLLLKSHILALLQGGIGARIRIMLEFASKHAFGLFLLHIPILALVEYLLGFTGLSKLISGGLRLILTVLLSFAVVPLFSALTHYFTTRISASLKAREVRIVATK